MIRAAVIAVCLAAAPAVAQVPEPAGFRGEPYAAPVPDTLEGAQVVDGETAFALWDKGVAFVDVYPRRRKPEGLPEDTIWKEPPHMSVPGAVWLWDTGFESLSEPEQQRLADGLARVTGNDPDKELVIFCRADCWMSWNAAKRAVTLGYRNVMWFPGGTDEWQTMSAPDLVSVEPVAP